MKRRKKVAQIRDRIPYGTINFEYHKISEITKKNVNFEKKIDQKLKQFEKKGVDAGTCLEYLENMIDEYIIGLLNDLETERLDSKNVIGSFFRKRASDKSELKKMLNYIEEEISSTKEDYDAVKLLYEKYNPLENGKLKIESIKASEVEGDEDI